MFGRLVLIEHVDCQPPHSCQILLGVSNPDSTGVFIKDNIQDPMDIILNPPVGANSFKQFRGWSISAANVVATLLTGFPAQLPFSTQPDNAVQFLPISTMA